MEVENLGWNIMVALLSAFIGAAGAAWGATWSLREKIMDIKDNHGSRLQTAESKLGITKEGTLTGNGILSEVSRAHRRIDDFLNQEARDIARIDRRNRLQHPGDDD